MDPRFDHCDCDPLERCCCAECLVQLKEVHQNVAEPPQVSLFIVNGLVENSSPGSVPYYPGTPPGSVSYYPGTPPGSVSYYPGTPPGSVSYYPGEAPRVIRH
jgi:hypothetical protein